MDETKEVIFKKERVSIFYSEEHQNYYLGLPVENGMVEYNEYYEISEKDYDLFCTPDGKEELHRLIAKCRSRQNDDKLLFKPGRLRGS